MALFVNNFIFIFKKKVNPISTNTNEILLEEQNGGSNGYNEITILNNNNEAAQQQQQPSNDLILNGAGDDDDYRPLSSLKQVYTYTFLLLFLK